MKCLMKILVTLALAMGLASAQISTPSSASATTATPVNVPSSLPISVPPSVQNAITSATNVTWLPKTVITGGGGFISPGSGKFVFGSESFFLGAGTYSTVAVEETLVNGQVESCTLAGVTKPLYQFSYFTVGLTGLGGGCVATTGSSVPAGSGQGFLDVRFGKTPFGLTLTGTKNTNGGGVKVTLAFRWAQ